MLNINANLTLGQISDVSLRGSNNVFAAQYLSDRSGLAGDSTITRLLPAELGSLTADGLDFEPLALMDFFLAVVFLTVVFPSAFVDARLLVVIYRCGSSDYYLVHAAKLLNISI